MSNFRTGTPLQEFELPFNYEDYGKDILITYSQNNRVIIEKQRDDVRIEKNIITFTLRQEETKSFCAGVIALQIKLLDYTDNVIISDIFYTNLKEVLSGKLFVISESKLEELTATANGEYYPSENKVGFSKVTVQVPDINGSYDEGYAQGGAITRKLLLNTISPQENFSLTKEDLMGATVINGYVFYKNKYINNIEIPDGVTSIGYNAFDECSNLTSVTIPNSVTFIGGSAFRNCTSLTSITVPNNVTNIDGNTFYNCNSLTSLTIGNSITSIGYSAFYNCNSLTNIEIPNSVTSIGNGAFQNCFKLTSVTIGNSVTSIGGVALQIGASYDKATITFLGTTPPTISSDTFSKNKLNQIIVPKGSRATYIASTNWASYADYIVESEV